MAPTCIHCCVVWAEYTYIRMTCQGIVLVRQVSHFKTCLLTLCALVKKEEVLYLNVGQLTTFKPAHKVISENTTNPTDLLGGKSCWMSNQIPVDFYC